MLSVASRMASRVAGYLGTSPGGVDLRTALAALPSKGLTAFAQALERRRSSRGRVFFLGNGGSFDNARLLAARCRAHGLRAQVPGQVDDYLELAASHGYAAVFALALAQEQLGPEDLVVGISGSGNSPNIIQALETAQAAGAECWCLGGRDGGAMRRLCGDAHALIGVNQCMEAIEDLHVAMLVVALDAIEHQLTAAAALNRYLEAFDFFATPDAVEGIARLAEGMLGSIASGGRMFILGTSIGASHIRADLGRGATNAIPVRGITAPEFFSMNSAMATANDDGLDYVLVDGLVKFEPGPGDLALLIDAPSSHAAIALCRELLESSGTPMLLLGDSGISLRPFARYDQDTAVAMIGHICGECIRAEMHERWQARRLDHVHAFPPGHKKLGIAQTEALQAELSSRGVLKPGEELTFCYGTLFAVRPPDQRPQRCYF